MSIHHNTEAQRTSVRNIEHIDPDVNVLAAGTFTHSG